MLVCLQMKRKMFFEKENVFGKGWSAKNLLPWILQRLDTDSLSWCILDQWLMITGVNIYLGAQIDQAKSLCVFTWLLPISVVNWPLSLTQIEFLQEQNQYLFEITRLSRKWLSCLKNVKPNSFRDHEFIPSC